MKPTIIRYPIPGNEGGGLLHIYGERKTASNNNINHVILYCGGWPDGVEPFSHIASRLATSRGGGSSSSVTTNSEEYQDGCFVGITCWPGFDTESYRRQQHQQQKSLLRGGFKREGYNFYQVSCCIREAAKHLFIEYYRRYHNQQQQHDRSTATVDNKYSNMNNNLQTKPQFTVIFHDFGVLPGLMYVNQSIEENDYPYDNDFGDERNNNRILPDRIVLLDVLLEPHGKFKTPDQIMQLSPYTTYELLVYLAYRGTFACAFAMLRFLHSEVIGLVTLWILYTLVILLGLAPLHPRSQDVKLLNQRRMDQFHLIYTFYPYYHIFQALLFNRNKKELVHGCLPLDLVKTPILYLYGEDKNVVSVLHNYYNTNVGKRYKLLC